MLFEKKALLIIWVSLGQLNLIVLLGTGPGFQKQAWRKHEHKDESWGFPGKGGREYAVALSVIFETACRLVV